MQREAQQPDRFARRYLAYLEQQDAKVLLQLKSDPLTAAHFTPAILIAYLLSAFVHAITFLVVIASILLLTSRASLCTFILGPLLLFVAWEIRPRLPQIQADVAARGDLPALYKLANEIAVVIGTTHIETIAIDPTLNASFGRYGYRGKRVLVIGTTLWCRLTPDERVALIAHELAHDVNGDFSQQYMIWAALNTLARLTCFNIGDGIDLKK